MTSSHRFISAVPAILLSASFLFASVDTNAADSTDFTGLGFGVGLSLTVDTGSNDRVKSASLVNGYGAGPAEKSAARHGTAGECAKSRFECRVKSG